MLGVLQEVNDKTTSKTLRIFGLSKNILSKFKGRIFVRF